MRFALYSSILLLAASGCDNGGSAGKDGPNQITSYPDEDGDTITDMDEGYVDPANEDGLTSTDSDGDGLPDYQDKDSDEDGILDQLEAGDKDATTLPWDSDVDGLADFRDTDADGNCILDTDEGTDDFDGDGIGDWHDVDDDGDNLLDSIEMGGVCELRDSDSDGTPDYRDDDSDGDGVGDKYESGTSEWETTPADTDGDGTPDYLDLDSDGDGYSDRDESGGGGPGTAPRDTDGDGSYDSADTDSDGDGLDDIEEGHLGLDPYDADTDGDGFTDGAEATAGTDPKDPGSVIDGVYVTVPERTTVEQDFDFTLNVQLGDVVFALDTTGSMSGLAQGMGAQFSTIVAELASTLPDANYGFATYDDYADNIHGSSSSGDRPFILHSQLTDDVASVQAQLGAIAIHYGVDEPESTMEALYQSLTGNGYDQNCNGSYDSSTDVRPFIASSADAFHGAGGETYDSAVSGSGTGGGFGFRDYALPVVIYATDAHLRDSESSAYGAGPNGCAQDAGKSHVVAGTLAAGAYLIGIAVNGSAPTAQMQDLAAATSSYADTDGDGAADDPLVFSWSGSSSTLKTTIVNAVDDLVASVQFSTVTLEVANDEFGFVSSVDPESFDVSGSATGQELTFTLNFRGAVAATDNDQVFQLTLNVVGDGTVLLDTLDIFVVVPGDDS